MTKSIHRAYLFLLGMVVVAAGIYLTMRGLAYYQTGLEERFYHPDHTFLKPSGLMGHGLGIAGTLLILVGVFGYMARKRYRWMYRWGLLKHWLEFHIFLCTLGPLMILFHTAFKFGGIVSISFWSMVAVFLSGIVGRFIYLQIPRTIEGRELSLQEVLHLQTNIQQGLQSSTDISAALMGRLLQLFEYSQHSAIQAGFVSAFLNDRRLLQQAVSLMKAEGLDRNSRKKIRKLLRSGLSLQHRIARLQRMQQLFKYWHVAHLPFALVMLVIMVIHVAVTLVLGFKWIF